jgi:hypothetical protein
MYHQYHVPVVAYKSVKRKITQNLRSDPKNYIGYNYLGPVDPYKAKIPQINQAEWNNLITTKIPYFEMCIKHASPILKRMGYDDQSIAALTKGYSDIGFTGKENGWLNQSVASKENIIADCIADNHKDV